MCGPLLQRSAVIASIAALEEIGITLVLNAPRSNVRGRPCAAASPPCWISPCAHPEQRDDGLLSFP